jgi:hypothetical protein
MLYSYYSLDEVINKKEVLLALNKFQKEGKLKYNLEGDILNIVDLDLDELEIGQIIEIFEQNDIIPYLEREIDEDNDPFDNFYDDFDDEY